MSNLPLTVLKSGYEKSNACNGCGNCCKNLPGAFFPDDIQDKSAKHLAELMIQGKVAVDWWEGDPRHTVPPHQRVYEAYYLRPRTKNHSHQHSPRNASWGGECSMLNPDGCSLSFNDRPTECRHLKPKEDRNCVGDPSFSKRSAAISWLPFRSVIKEAIELAEEKM